MIDDTTHKLLAPDVKAAAHHTAWRWAGTIDQDDAEQEIWARILEAGQSTIDKLAGMDQPLRRSSLVKIGKQIASNERDDFDVFSGNWTYGTEDVRALLKGGGLTCTLSRPGTLTHSEVVDLHNGFRQLQDRNARYAHLVKEKYVNKVRLDNSDPDRKATDRAIDALTVQMNRARLTSEREYTDGPGTRRAVSNAEAQYMTRQEYKR